MPDDPPEATGPFPRVPTAPRLALTGDEITSPGLRMDPSQALGLMALGVQDLQRAELRRMELRASVWEVTRVVLSSWMGGAGWLVLTTALALTVLSLVAGADVAEILGVAARVYTGECVP